MAATIVRAPFTRELLLPILQTSATAAVATCTGGQDGNQCGMRWYQGNFDGSTGVGEQMCALEVVQSNLIDYVSGPVTADGGGISQGNPSAGTKSPIGPGDLNKSTITTADRAGAGILTAGVIILVVGTVWWMIAS